MQRARAAIEKLSGIDQFWIGGARAVFTAKAEGAVQQEQVASSYQKQNMKLASLRQVEMQKPAVILEVPSQGLG